MDRADAVSQLPLAYGLALRLDDRGASEAAIARLLGVEREAVAPLLGIARDKLAALLEPRIESRAPR